MVSHFFLIFNEEMSVRSWVILLFVVVGVSFTYHVWVAGMSSPIRSVAPVQVPNDPSHTVQISQNRTFPTVTKPLPELRSQSFTGARSGAIRSENVNPRYTQKPTEMSVEFEMVNGLAVSYGDTILGQPLNGFSEKRGIAEIPHPKYWEGGVVPYLIKPDVGEVGRIKQAIDYFNQNTSVRFVPHDGQQADAIVFERGTEHCYSYLGRVGGLQPVMLSDRCGTQQIMHELMHVLGFVHEQSRTDRDQYVQILWENIEEKYHAQFAMVPEPLMNSYFGSVFDPRSIMMYEPTAFAVNPDVQTMKMRSGVEISPAKISLSPIDLERVNKLYPTVVK